MRTAAGTSPSSSNVPQPELRKKWGPFVGRTSFVIAHRLSTIREADKVVVMSDGRIVEVGTHDELMERGGMYYNLYTMQWQGQGDLAADQQLSSG